MKLVSQALDKSQNQIPQLKNDLILLGNGRKTLLMRFSISQTILNQKYTFLFCTNHTILTQKYTFFFYYPGKNMSFCSFQKLMKTYPAHCHQCKEKICHPLRASPQVIILLQKRNNMINNRPKLVLDLHFVIAGEEKRLSIRLQRRATHW